MKENYDSSQENQIIDSRDANKIKNYKFLKEIGIIDEIEELKKTIAYKNELLVEAAEIFSKHSIKELITYLSEKLLNKFIPDCLVFITQEELNANKAQIQCFKNLKPAKNCLTIESFLLFKEYFKMTPHTTSFKVFKYLVDNSDITDIFLPLSPELVVPMMGMEGMYGFIILGSKVARGAYTTEDINYIDSLMSFASVSLQNNIHYKRAIVDLKTKVYNYDYFIIKLEEELARSKRHRSMISILLLDVDHFKKFNDKFGHLMGDKMLTLISSILVKHVRTEDIVARYGGEEFCIMLIQCSTENAILVSNRMREEIEKASIFENEKEAKATISIGISFGSNQFKGTAKELLHQADIALYESKKKGRNRSTLFTKDMI